MITQFRALGYDAKIDRAGNVSRAIRSEFPRTVRCLDGSSRHSACSANTGRYQAAAGWNISGSRRLGQRRGTGRSVRRSPGGEVIAQNDISLRALRRECRGGRRRELERDAVFVPAILACIENSRIHCSGRPDDGPYHVSGSGEPPV